MQGIIMPAIKKERNTELGYGKAIVSNTVKDHSNDPFVVKKAEEAKAFLRKNGFPGQVKNNN
jgi:hypothetical protein